MPPVKTKFAPGRQSIGRTTVPLHIQPGKPGYVLRISGVTRDSAGAALAACTVKLFRTRDNVFVTQKISDESGNYSFDNVSPDQLANVSVGEQFYTVAYKAGSPDVAGTSLNTLVGSSA